MTGLYVLWQLLQVKEGRWTTIIAGFVAGIIGIALWLVPVYFAFNGFDNYLSSIDDHRLHIQEMDSILSHELSGTALNLRVTAYIEGWTELLAGGSSIAFALIAGVIALGII